MISFQAGCPTVWIYHDSRTQELCETMGLPRISIEEFLTEKITTVEDIKQFCVYDPTEYSDKRIVLKEAIKNILSQYRIKNLL